MDPNKKLKVLLVEDDPLLVKMYSTKFGAEGFEVFIAQDGLDGLNSAITNHPDFIILDVMMPRLSGIDMLKRLRSDPQGANIPVLVLSNLSQEDEAKKAIELGAKEYLVKANFTPGEVVSKVRLYLQKQ